MATEMNRLTVSVTPQIEKEIKKMRMTKEFCESSRSEIIRYLIIRGLEHHNNTKNHNNAS